MQQGAARSGYHGLVLAGYLAIACAMYWRALDAFFLSDDFVFLDAVVSSPTWLAGDPTRFFRPLVVLMYAVCYRVSGLDPRSFHVVVLLLHVFNAFCVYLIASRLLRDTGRLIWTTAGLLFLVFSSHSEAVAWPAGVADPALGALLLPAFLAYLRAVEPGAPPAWTAVAIALMATGVLAKESWVVMPAIVLAHAVILGDRDQRVRRRAVLVIGVGFLLILGYVAGRRLLFGSVAGGYAGLASSLTPALFFDTARIFVLRCVIPGGLRALAIWQHHLDLVLWAAAALLIAFAGNRKSVRVVVFGAAAMLIALSPTLPLTISVVTTESERFTYIPTVFSCLAMVAAATAVFRRRALVVIACVPLIIWHGVVLRRNTARLHDAGEMSRQIVATFATTVRTLAANAPAPIFILNLPDNLSGAYVFRRGFYEAVALLAPDVSEVTDRTIGVATNAVGYRGDPVHVTRVAARRFKVDFGVATIVQPRIPDAVWYRITAQTPTSYEVEFTDAVRHGTVVFTTAGRTELAGTIDGPGVPFGLLELPDDGATCNASRLRFAGWALGEQSVTRVSLDVLDSRGESYEQLGDARRIAGTRPDVATRFRWLPGADRAEWEYDLPCAVVAAPHRDLIVRATAVDDEGRRVELGRRAVKNAR